MTNPNHEVERFIALICKRCGGISDGPIDERVGVCTCTDENEAHYEPTAVVRHSDYEAMEIAAAQWQGSFEGVVACEKELKAKLKQAEAEYDQLAKAARRLVNASAGHPSRPSAQRASWDQLKEVLDGRSAS